MKLTLALTAALVSVAIGAAFAQVETATLPQASPIAPAWGQFDSRSSFDARPNGRDFARLYPSRALNRGVVGVTTLCCKPSPDRTLKCRVGAEWPDNSWGFGDASVALGPIFRLNPAAFDVVSAYPDAELRVPITWNLTPSSRRADELMSQASAVMSRAVLCQGETRRSPTS